MRTLLFGIVALAAWGGLASPVAACSVTGWSVREAGMNAVSIIEAEVLRTYEGGGYEVAVRQVIKGDVPGKTIAIGREATTREGIECGGQLDLAVSDHVILASVRLDELLAIETAAWWVERDGTVDRTNLVPNDRPTTRAAVLRALRLAAPDTSTAPSVPAASGDSTPLWIVGIVASILLFHRFRTAANGRRVE